MTDDALEVNSLLSVLITLKLTGAAYQLLMDAVSDGYTNQDGIDLSNSTGQTYIPTQDLYNHGYTFDSYTQLMLHMDGTDASTTFTDSSIGAHTVTAQGSAQIDTAQYKFGGASGLFNGTSGYLDLGTTSDYHFGAGDFTIDCWFRLTTNNREAMIYSDWDVTGMNMSICLDIRNTNVLKARFKDVGSTIYTIDGTTTFSTGTWYHIAFVRNGADLKLFINGTQEGGTVNVGSNTQRNRVGNWTIGRAGDYADFYIDGWIDEFRISKGIARWTSNFTPPASAYAPSVYDMTLRSIVFTAQAAPSTARIVMVEEDIDAVTLNTDLKAYVSRNNGSTFSQVTLANEGNYASGIKILTGTVDVSGQSSGTSMIYKIEALNSKQLNIRGTCMSWE